MLSLGCSTGLGVQAMAKMGFDAYGVDVSAEAIRVAYSLGRGSSCSVAPCLINASLTSLPYPSGHFPSAISSDVLEHIHPNDIQTVIAEITRVVSRHLVLRIATKPEARKMKLNGVVQRLHLTVEPAAWWVKQFEAAGWRQRKGIVPKSNVNLANLALDRPS